MNQTNHPAWTHVRIKRSTKESLEEFGKWLAANYRRTGNGPAEPDQGFSVDALVNILLEREEDHRERNRKASLKRKQARVNRSRGHVVFQDSPDGVDYVVPDDLLEGGKP